MKTNSDAPRTLYLGLDVHKEKTSIAILESDRDREPRYYGEINTSQHALERAIRRIAKSNNRTLAELHLCYEASGCEFWIARRLLQMGVHCEVIAPSLIPTKSGDRVKTDKRDVMKLAKNLRSNDLVPVNIPDSVEEAVRDLCRGRTDAVDDLRRTRWILELSWSTQLRLNTRFNALAKRRMHHNKIKVAVARELCAFLWELGTRIESNTHAA